jgi:hypothetical protein
MRVKDLFWTGTALIVGTMPTTSAAANPPLVATVMVFEYTSGATPRTQTLLTPTAVQIGIYARNRNGDEVTVLNDAGKPATTCLTNRTGSICAFHAQKIYINAGHNPMFTCLTNQAGSICGSFSHNPEMAIIPKSAINGNVNGVICSVFRDPIGNFIECYSPDYQVVMRLEQRLTINGQAKRLVRELSNVQLTEPDPQLFVLDLTGYSAATVPSGGGGGGGRERPH